MTLQMGLVLSAIAFLGTHFLMSHPLRAPLVRAMGEGPFRGVYSLIAILTFGAMIYFYGKIGREPQLWDVGEAGWIAGTLLMWLGSILFVGSIMGNPALPGARGPSGASPRGVFAITRHPMMWGFALWGIVHLALVAMPKALFLDGSIILLALAGAAGQDRKKQRLLGDRWYAWVAHTSFIPFARGIRSPGATAFVGGTILWLGATWLHPGHAAGVWRWIG